MLIIEYTVGNWGSSYRNSMFSVQFFSEHKSSLFNRSKVIKQKVWVRTSWVVQWLRIHQFTSANAEDMILGPGRFHMPQGN